MLKAIQKAKEALEYINLNNTTNTDFKEAYFNSFDWFSINYLVEILEVFVKPSVLL